MANFQKAKPESKAWQSNLKHLVDEAIELGDVGSAGSLEARAANLPQHDCSLVNLADIKPEPVSWLWENRIPLGMFSLLAGQPGEGKTTLSHSIAAIVTTGSLWPYSDHRAAVGRVIILTAEDSIPHTLVPRLMAAGADLTRVSVIQSVARPQDDHVVDSPLLLSQDMHQLHGVLDQYPDTRLLIIDPLSAYLGVKDSHRDADVRQVLGPLTELAARHEVAILGITHLSKAANNSALARFMGSTGIVAAARAAYLATRHEDQLMFLPVKSNIAPAGIGGLTYRVVTATIRGGIQTACVEWTGQTEVEADDALAAQVAKRSAPKKHDAAIFLQNMLIDGPRPLQEIHDAADLEGFAWATIRRAYDELGIKAIKEAKFQGRWLWHTPEQAEQVRRQECP